MPLRLAVFNINSFGKIPEQFPEIEHWYIGGHSLGGAMASSYVSNHPDQENGPILLGAKPIFHSDRGSQYTSSAYREVLERYSITQSMGRTGVCYDNARMESFFATLKQELVYDLPYQKMTREQLRVKIFSWIEVYYNSQRRHTSNQGNLPPLIKRRDYYKKIKQVA